MKKIIIATGFIFLAGFIFAQSKIMAVPTSQGIVIHHKVAPKEGIYPLARKYNVKVSDILVANNFDKNKSLNVGEIVKIPLPFDNLNQKSQKGIPVMYVVSEKEGLMTVSNKFNKVLLKNLRSWNHLSKDELSKGQQLIVGYLSLDGEQQSVAQEEITDKPVVKKKTEQEPVLENPKNGIVEEKKQEQPKPAPVAEIPGKGYFKNLYAKQTNENSATQKTVTSGIFKASNGWGDGKYYILIDDVAVGTIIKVSNPENGAIIYAKVLGQMKGIKQNEGLDIRISDSAAMELKISDTEKFIVTITY